ncbi:hypothetical protein K435DRAFT_969816 [Dendrothele bispora CBS 962.96]|uniref:Zn(2)-C6 fungal-type domain-containing protein n=1 Tax=Dendrothele bispora (strain CBS 962.96) TaxID=1314807 RepID=A0A4S8LF94_DENBC|nr:hypothetical protein K435DRAFT_969816 [Dendrothele bispora CBS 962.96]
MSTEDATHGTRKRRRLQNACDECRRRKVRCDSSNMPDGNCSGCINLNIQCTHISKRKKRGPKTGSVSNVAVKATITAIISRSYVIPEDRDAIWEVLADIANYVQHLEKEVTRARRKESLVEMSSLVHATQGTGSGSGASPQSIDTVDDSDYSSTDELTEEIENFHISRMKHRHFGKSSSAMFILRTLNVAPDIDIIMRPEYWHPFNWQLTKLSEPQPVPLDFPEGEHLQELLNFYFDHHHPCYSLLHRKSFERSVSEGLHLRDRYFGSLLLAVCAVSSRDYGDSRSLPEQPCSTLGFGWRWFRQLTLVRTKFNEPITLFELQTYCLACFYLQSTILSDVSWVLNGFAIRLAQERGIHRRKLSESKPTLERELWKRAFWHLILFDTMSSIFFGRPRATLADDFDTEPLIECDEDAWDDPAIVDILSLPSAPKSPIIFFNHLIKIMEIIGFAQRTLYPVKRSELSTKMGISTSDWTRKAVTEIDSALNNWMDNIPNHLRWDPHCENETFLSQSVLLYAVYYWTQILVHSPFIPKPGESSVIQDFPSMAICVNAARSCLHIIESHSSKRRTSCNAILLTSLFNSCIVLLLNIFRGKELKINFDPQKELRELFKAINILRGWEDRHQLAGRFYDLLDALAKRSVPVPYQQQASLKRPRDTGTDMGPSSQSATLDAIPINVQDGQAKQVAVAPSITSQDISVYPQTRIDQSLGGTSHETNDESSFILPLSSSELGDLPLFQLLNPSETSTGFDVWSSQELFGANAGTQQSQRADWFYNSQSARSEGQSQLATFSDPSLFSSQQQQHSSIPDHISAVHPSTFPSGLVVGGNEMSQQEWGQMMVNIDQLLQLFS